MKTNMLITLVLFLALFQSLPMWASGEEVITPYGWSGDGRYFVFEHKRKLNTDSETTYTLGVIFDSYTMRSSRFLLKRDLKNKSDADHIVKFYGGISTKEFKEWIALHPLQKIESRVSGDKTITAIVKTPNYITGSWRNNVFHYEPTPEFDSGQRFSFLCKSSDKSTTLSGVENIYLIDGRGMIRAFWSPDRKRIAWILPDIVTSIDPPLSQRLEAAILTINEYNSYGDMYPFIIGPTQGPRVQIAGELGVFVSPITTITSEKISEAGYVLTSVRTTEAIRNDTFIEYKKEFRADAEKIAKLIPGEKNLALLKSDKNAEIVVTIGDSALMDYAEKHDFSFNIPVYDNYYRIYLDMSSFKFLGWTKDSSLFVHEQSAHGCCGDMSSSDTATIYNAAIGYSATFFLKGYHGGHGIGSYGGMYDRGMYRVWLRKHALKSYAGLTSPDTTKKAFSYSEKKKLSLKNGELLFDEGDTFVIPENVVFLVNESGKIFKSNAWNEWEKRGSAGHGVYEKVSVYWSPDSKKIIFVPGDWNIMGMGSFYIIPGPAGGPRVALKLSKTIHEDNIKRIRQMLFSKDLFVVKVERDAVKREQSTLYYIKDFEAEAKRMKSLIPDIETMTITEKQRFADIILEVGDDTIVSLKSKGWLWYVIAAGAGVLVAALGVVILIVRKRR